MKPAFRNTLLLLLLTASLASASLPLHTVIPETGGRVNDPYNDTTLPSLAEFTRQVISGSAGTVTGVYSEETFAFPVIQQPPGQPAFVSLTDDEVTQFSLASSAGSLGFLAHNTLAGAVFSTILPGQLITVIHGDGQSLSFQVEQIRRFQAVSPSSPYSSFIDLENHKTLSATDLFLQTYGVKGNFILQTCIASGDVDSWGRLFVIAAPIEQDGTR